MSHKKYYFDFLLRCERQQPWINQSSAHLSSTRMALFELLAVKHAQGQTLTVSQTMALPNMASSAALHKRIDDLREAGMICVVFKGADRRTKYLVPTDKGNRYLSIMGDLFIAHAHLAGL